MNYSRMYTRHTTLPIDDVLKMIASGVQSFSTDTQKGTIKVKLNGPRLGTYLKGTTCVFCGLEASYFAIERQNKSGSEYHNWHLNLYANPRDGKEIMMTSDHIHPKALGGSDNIENRQPLCAYCNTEKGTFRSLEEARWWFAQDLIKRANYRMFQSTRRPWEIKLFDEIQTQEIAPVIHDNEIYVLWNREYRVLYSKDPKSPDNINKRMLNSRIIISRGKRAPATNRIYYE